MTNARQALRAPTEAQVQASQHVLAAISRFGRYKAEQSHEVKKAIVVESAPMQRIVKAWELYLSMDTHDSRNNNEIERMIEGTGHSAEDIRRFCTFLIPYQDDGDFSMKSGYFLSLLMNRSQDRSFSIETKHLDLPIDNIGFENDGKIIHVNGDVGEMAGLRMKSGTLHVHGNARNDVGRWLGGGSIIVDGDSEFSAGNKMDDGTLLIYGNAGPELGKEMKGGIIVVIGDAAGDVGKWMKAGTISVDGDIGSFYRYGNDALVRIFHRGILQ